MRLLVEYDTTEGDKASALSTPARFPLVAISKTTMRRLQFRALCCLRCKRPTRCHWKRSQLPVTTTLFLRSNLASKLSRRALLN